MPAVGAWVCRGGRPLKPADRAETHTRDKSFAEFVPHVNLGDEHAGATIAQAVGSTLFSCAHAAAAVRDETPSLT